jgi:hypothetical protein
VREEAVTKKHYRKIRNNNVKRILERVICLGIHPNIIKMVKNGFKACDMIILW